MSSSSDLVLPPNAKIVKAYLYAECYGGQLTSCRFRVPGGNYVLMNAASPGFIARPVSGSYGQLIFDVTSMVAPSGYTSNYIAGGDPSGIGSYAVADVSPYYSAHNGYGWCLYVVYTSPTAKFRNVTIADACQVMDYLNSPTVSFDIPNVLVPQTGTVNAVVAITGCWGENGSTLLDNLKIGRSGSTQTQLADPSTGSTTDVYNGTIGVCAQNCVTVDGGPNMSGPYIAKNYNSATATANSYWYDSDIFNATGTLPVSATPITVRVTSTAVVGDIFTAGAFAVAVEIQSALVTKSLSPTSIPSGGKATYTFTVDNTIPGGRNQTNLGFTDTIPGDLVIANPNNVVITGGTGGVVTAAPGSNIFKLSGLNLNAGQLATITVDVTNKPGKYNLDCSANPKGFTNAFGNLGGLTPNLSNGVEPQCLIVFGAPDAGFKNDTVCPGIATTFTDTSKALSGTTINKWEWDFGDGTTSTNQSPTHTFPGAGTYQVKLKVTDNAMQSDSVTKSVIVKPKPTVTLGAAPSICKGDTAQLSATGGGTYLWDPAASLTSATIANPKAFPTNTTTYKVTVTDATTKCALDTTVIVTVRALPSIQVTGSLSVCPGGNPTTITASNTNVVPGATTYLWTPGGQTTASISVNPPVETDYTVQVTDATGCKNTKLVTIVMSPPPSGMMPAVVNRSCQAADGSITITSVSGGVAPYQYAKNGGSFQTSNKFSNLDSADYTITVKDSKGCTYDQVINVSITPAASSASISTASSGCGAPSGNITINSVSGGIAPYTYSTDNVTFQAGTTFSPLGSGSYQVFIKDGNGCVYNTSATVGSLSGPSNMTAIVTADSCAKNNGSIKITNVTGGTTPYLYSIDGITYNSNNVFTNLQGVTTTIYTKDAANCTFSKAFNVPFLPPVTGFGTAIIADSCALNTGEISVNNEQGGVSPYKYQLDNLTPQSSYEFKQLVTNSYQVTLIDKNGCSLTQPSTVPALAPILSVTPTITAATCGYSNGAVSLTSTGGTAPISWQLDADPIVTANNFTGVSIGDHFVTAIDANNCKFPQLITIADTPGPNGVNASQTTTSCTGPTGIYTINSVSGGTAPYEYSLNSGPFSSTSTFSNLSAQQYDLDVKDANGCIYPVSFTILVAASPTDIVLTPVNTTCSQSNGSITITGVTGGNGGFDFSLDNSSFTPNRSYTGLASGTHKLIVKDVNQCTYEKEVILTDAPSPVGFKVETKPTFCNKDVGQVIFHGSIGGTAPFTYAVNNTNYTTDTTFGGFAPGTYPIHIKDVNGCTHDSTVTIQDIAGPSNFTVTHSDDTCGRNSGSITVLTISGPASPFTYSINGTTFQAAKKFSGVAPGTYTVIGQDTNGCQVTKVETVGIVNGPDTAKVINITEPHCNQADGEAQVMVNSISGGTPQYSITMNNVTNPPNGIFKGLSAGTYILTISDKYKCLKTQPVKLTDIPGPQSTINKIEANRCSENNGSVTFENVTSGTAPYKFSDDNVSYVMTNKFGDLAAGNMQFYVKDDAGCVLMVPVSIPDAPGPTDISIALIHENCDRGDGSLGNLQAVGGTLPISFIVNNSVVVNDGGSVDNLSRGPYTIQAVDAYGCKLDKVFTVKNIPGPIAEFEPSLDEAQVPVDIKMINYSPDSCTYDWTFGDGNSAAGYDALNYYTDSGEYVITLTIANKAGCTNSTERVIHLKPSVFFSIPNTFTPNGDGVNDYFTAHTENIKSFELSIFNRWGELIATVTETSEGWNGLYKSSMCREDVYVYHFVGIDYQNLKHKSSGKVQLLK